MYSEIKLKTTKYNKRNSPKLKKISKMFFFSPLRFFPNFLKLSNVKFAQAFDKVWHNDLLYKQVLLKFPLYIVNWIKKFKIENFK